MLENIQSTEDLMCTLNKTKTKEDVFAKYRTLFEEHYKKNAEFESQK
jgi:hypothetical protein